MSCRRLVAVRAGGGASTIVTALPYRSVRADTLPTALVATSAITVFFSLSTQAFA
ncbi:hypothetical protein [Actinophytocola sp. NPDC049390]|uniref:hypothetical protein n=1 Tax=Actinophytocola sp. NPDC049390 TaxID=3363894 RepID=UPI0037B77301